MIGQTMLLSRINTLLENFPKFVILTGAKGSGKRSIAHFICARLGVQVVEFGTGIDEVREIIELSYEQTSPICYFCPDADSMSLGAKNALLKITEEPPNHAFFILTLLSMTNTLETIQSRATVLPLDNYTPDELVEYRKYKLYGSGFDNIVQEICTNTGEVDALFEQDVPSFYKFAETVAFQIHLPTSGNIFKIPASLKIKESDKGFDPVLLFKTVRELYIKKGIKEKNTKYLLAANVTSECLRDLALPTVNKVGTVDKWIMDVRKVLR